MHRQSAASVVFAVFLTLAIPSPSRAVQTDSSLVGNYLTQLLSFVTNPSYVDRYYTTTNSGNLAWGESYILRAVMEAYLLTGDRDHLRRMAMHADSLFAVARDVPEGVECDTTIYQDGYLGWGSTAYSDGYDEFIVHDGHFCGPLAQYIAVVFADSTLWEEFGQKAQEHLAFLQQNVVSKWMPYLEGEVSYPVTDPWGITMRQWAGLLRVPHNQYSAFGLLLLALDDLTRTPRYQALYPDEEHPEYRRLAVEMGEFFQEYVVTRANDAYQWTYGPGDRDEDISHANLELEFVVALHDRGLVFDDADMVGFGRTITRILWNGDLEYPRFAKNVSGNGDDTWSERMWGWGLFGQHYPLAWYLIDRYFQERVYENGETIRTSYVLVAMARLQRTRQSFLSGGLLMPVGFEVNDEDGDGLVRPGESAEIGIHVRNFGFSADSSWVRIGDLAPLQSAVGAESLLVRVEPGSTEVASLGVFGPPELQTAGLTMKLQAGYYELPADVAVGAPSVMFVQGVAPPADHGHEDAFFSSLYLSEPPHRLYYKCDSSLTPQALNNYRVVIWRCGRALPSTDEIGMLADYLDRGGHLVLTGGGVFREIIQRSEEDSLFMVNYLRITNAYDVTDSLEGLSVTVGATSSSRFTGIGSSSMPLRTTTETGARPVPCDVFETSGPDDQTVTIAAKDGAGTVRALPTSIAGLGVDSTYHAVVLGWDFDDMYSTTVDPLMLILSALSWLESPTSVSRDDALHPAELAVDPFPNPFNPVTNLRISGLELGKPALVIVTNVLGQRVDSMTLMPTAGEHTIQWEPRTSSGGDSGVRCVPRHRAAGAAARDDEGALCEVA